MKEKALVAYLISTRVSPEKFKAKRDQENIKAI